MSWSPSLTTLRNRLAALFSTEADARRIVAEAQLNPAYIAFDSKAVNNWHNILSEADRHNKVEAIILAAIGQYGDDADLIAAYQSYAAATGKPAQLPAARSQSPPQSSVTSGQPIKILFLASNPRDMTPLKLDEEVRAIDQSLRLGEYRDRFDLQQHWAVRYSDLQGLLLRHEPDILHFSGHGVADDQIILMNDSGQSHPVSSQALAGLLGLLKDNIRCVLLNACYSPSQAQAIAEHIDVVIGMSGAITDQASYNFAASFYQALAYGRDVQTAFALGRNAIELADLDEQDRPQIFAPNSDPTQIVFARQVSNQLAEQATNESKYNIQIGNAQGIVVGDNAQVTQNFGPPSNSGDKNSEGRETAGSNNQPTSQELPTLKNELQMLLAQHQRNLLRLRQKKAIYAAGEEPLSLLNQIEHEETEIGDIQRRLHS